MAHKLRQLNLAQLRSSGEFLLHRYRKTKKGLGEYLLVCKAINEVRYGIRSNME